MDAESDTDESDEGGPVDDKAPTKDAMMADSSLDEHAMHRSDQSDQGKEDKVGRPVSSNFGALALRYKPAKLRIKLIVRDPTKDEARQSEIEMMPSSHG